MAIPDLAAARKLADQRLRDASDVDDLAVFVDQLADALTIPEVRRLVADAVGEARKRDTPRGTQRSPTRKTGGRRRG